MMTKTQIRKTTGMDTMFKTNATGQLSENCVFFDEILPGVHLTMAIIKSKPIVDNANFSVEDWYSSKTDFMKERLSSVFIDCIKPSDDIVKTRVNHPNGILARCFTVEPISGEEKDVISYLFNIRYKPECDFTFLKSIYNK